MEKLLTPDDAAELLAVTPRSVIEWLRTGKIKGVKVGRFWRIQEHALKIFIENNSKQSESETV